MRSFCFVRMLTRYTLCMVLILGIFFHDTAFAILHHKDVRDQIVSYLLENRDTLLENMSEVERWSERYHLLAVRKNDGGLIEGKIVSYPYSWESVTDDSVNRFFTENEIVFRIQYPVNSDIIVFETAGVGYVTSSMGTGFYYSPQDTPAWINSEQLLPMGLKTGKYMDYPMIQDGDGWAADTSVLKPYDADDQLLLKGYGLYTDQICVNFFYFESWY